MVAAGCRPSPEGGDGAARASLAASMSGLSEREVQDFAVVIAALLAGRIDGQQAVTSVAAQADRIIDQRSADARAALTLVLNLTGALRDVAAERQRQIDKGYTPEHDDEHPLSRILGYGGLTWHPPTYGSVYAARTRAKAVRMAACLVAGIEWLDRAALARPTDEATP